MHRSRVVKCVQLNSVHLHQALPHSLVGCTSQHTTVVSLLCISSARSKHIGSAQFPARMTLMHAVLYMHDKIACHSCIRLQHICVHCGLMAWQSVTMTVAGSISDYEGVNKVPKKTMPLIAVNTTAGTASEMTRFAIITDHARKVKMAIIDW